MVYSRGNVFVKPHHREHAIPDFVDPKQPIRASPYHKPHWANSSPYRKPHSNPVVLGGVSNNPSRVPGLEKRRMPRESVLDYSVAHIPLDNVSAKPKKKKTMGGRQ
jgi:hypothetical protein